MSAPADTPSSWDFPRGPAAARILLALGTERGLPARACLAGTGLEAEALDEPSTLVEAGQELAIARNLIAELGDIPGLGTEAGCRYTLGSLGIWGFALLTSPTARDVVRVGVRYAPLSFAFIRPIVEEDARELRTVLGDAEIPADVRGFFVERELAKLAAMLPLVLGSRDGTRFETVFDGDRARALGAALPGTDLRTGRDRHLFAIERRLLDAPLPQADAAAARELEAQCQQMLDRRQERRGFASRVRSSLLADLARAPDMATVAADLNMDERTLRRRLEAEGTTYRELLDEVRSAIAVELLTTAGLTAEEVARRLGYHDAAGFSRAFKRWTGTSPGRYRRHGAMTR